MEQEQIVTAHCNNCSGKRNHSVLHSHDEHWDDQIWDDPAAFIHGKDSYELLKCAGCGRVTLRHSSYCSEDLDDRGQQVARVTYYPPATFRREPSWLYGTSYGEGEDTVVEWPPEFVSRILREVYIALHGNCLGLAAMGVRALLESIMVERIGDQGSFVGNLRLFAQEGYISERQKNILEATLEVGHASIHRHYSPSQEDLRLVLDFTESLIELVYFADGKAAVLKQKVPPRPKRT